MEINIKNLLKNISQKGNSSTLLMSSIKIDKQLNFVEKFSRKMLRIDKEKPYKSHPDVIGIWPENIDKKSIKIEQVHDFIRKIQLKPFSAKLKIGIIISVDKTTIAAQNALLKTLEEPPQDTHIILTTSNINNLLPTIVSRCQILELKKDDEHQFNQDLINQILKSNIIERFSLVENILKQKNKTKQDNDIEELTENLLVFFRSRMLKKNKNNEILDIIRLIETTQKAIEKNVNKRLALENLMINLPLKGVDY